MKSVTYVCSIVVLAGVIALSRGVADDKSSVQKVDPKTEEVMKKAEAANTPGAAHKALDPLVGDWSAEVKMWMEPGKPPTVTKGAAKSKWALNGRFVQEEFSGECMGKPFRGINFIGYDNVRQKYRNVWLDDMSTTIVTSEGDADTMGKVITLGGDYSCPLTGEKHKQTKQILRVVSRDKHIFEMHDPTRGENSKTLEITYTRN